MKIIKVNINFFTIINICSLIEYLHFSTLYSHLFLTLRSVAFDPVYVSIVTHIWGNCNKLNHC